MALLAARHAPDPITVLKPSRGIVSTTAKTAYTCWPEYLTDGQTDVRTAVSSFQGRSDRHSLWKTYTIFWPVETIVSAPVSLPNVLGPGLRVEVTACADCNG